MAKEKPVAPATDTDTAAPAAVDTAAAAAPAAPAEAAKKGGVAIILPNGMKRAEYIRQEFGKGRKRGEIAKELGVAYQIVFAATKGMQVAAPAAAPAEAGTATAAAA